MKFPNLTPERIDIWCIKLDLVEAKVLELYQDLNFAEQERANKFIQPLHRDRWIVARGYLRRILSLYLAISPRQIEFNYASLGKPYLVGKKLEFNLSHSHSLGVYGVSANYPLGIDIEYTRHLPFVELVNRFFSPTEQAIFQTLPPSLHQAAFFHAWTQKEAYLKARGTGLHTPLDRIEVEIDPRLPPQIRRSETDGNSMVEPHIERLSVPDDYVGTIVIAGRGIHLEYQSCSYLT